MPASIFTLPKLKVASLLSHLVPYIISIRAVNPAGRRKGQWLRKRYCDGFTSDRIQAPPKLRTSHEDSI